jgi:hypothetical protein
MDGPLLVPFSSRDARHYRVIRVENEGFDFVVASFGFKFNPRKKGSPTQGLNL